MNRADEVLNKDFIISQKFVDISINEDRYDYEWKQMKKSSLLPFIRSIIYTAQCGCCLKCGIELELKGEFTQTYATIDHVIPRSKGGSQTSIKNMVLLCQKCNSKKSDNIPKRDFLVKHSTVLDRISLILKEKKCPSLYSFPKI